MTSEGIAKLEDCRFQAMVRQDIALLDRLIDDRGFFLDGAGRPQSKGDILEKFSTGARRYRRIDVTERHLEVNEQQAVSTGRIAVIEEVGGKIVQALIRYMAVYAATADWRLVSWQAMQAIQSI